MHRVAAAGFPASEMSFSGDESSIVSSSRGTSREPAF